MNIFYNTIEKQSEKALLISFPVEYNMNMHSKSIWMPKSQVNIISDSVIEIADWMVSKLERENAFHGYYMYFSKAE